ncbi:MAG: CoA transferase [Chloroflexi bacterium]|nr:CoA transferase [Chloroflexota bacterium]
MNSILNGIRVVDMTLVWSGPWAARILGDLGAEVLKIERPEEQPQPLAPHVVSLDVRDPEGRLLYQRNAYQMLCNVGKRSLAIDLTKPEGIALFKELVRISDIVIENFVARVMPRLGLGYEELRRVRPDLIMLSMPAMGLTGPERDYTAYGVSIEQVSGFVALQGYEDGEPHKSGINYGDPVAGIHGAAAALTALLHRMETGQGMHIDLSQRESAIGLVGETILDYSMNRRVGKPRGNRHPWMAPHNVYPCRGADKWVALAVSSDQEFRALCRAIGQPSLAQDPRFADSLSRKRHERELDPYLEAWTRGREHYEVMRALQRAGVCAGAVLNPAEAVTDDHFRAQGSFQWLDYPDGKAYPTPVLPWRAAGEPWPDLVPTTPYGAENAAVLQELLGVTEEQVCRLKEKGVLLQQGSLSGNPPS